MTFYENLYTETEEWIPDLDMVGCPRFSEVENSMLEATFDTQEILDSIKACAGDKAPGLDGFTMDLFKHCWEVIKEDLVATILNFHERSFSEKSLNATFVALIPKKAGVEDLKDFRPISLIGGAYKIIVKLLAEKLKKVIHGLVGRQQILHQRKANNGCCSDC